MKRVTDTYKLNLHSHSSPKTHLNSRVLRKNCTEAENVLWNELRNRKLENCKFRRQHPILEYIADFYCHELNLIIEVDGGIHNDISVKERDEGRTFELISKGYNILRFTNEEVFNKTGIVLREIKRKIMELRTSPPTPLL